MSVLALHKAVESGNLDLLKTLVEKRGYNIDEQDEHDTTPLILAASHGNFEIVKFLLSRGASRDICDEAGFNASAWAAISHHTKIETFISTYTGSENSIPLSNEQHEALENVLISKHSLITARAGSGKTTLLLSLINALLNRGVTKKNNILLLQFNRSVRRDSETRLRKTYGINQFYGVHTFSSLAFQVVNPDRGHIIEDQSSDEALADLLTEITRKEASVWFKVKYWWYLGELDREVGEGAEDYTTLLGEEVKSFGEKVIADFLFANALEYRYEPIYQWGEHQYRPDFEVRGESRKAIIEYWGVSETRYDRSDYEQSAYVAQIQHKRNYWRQNQQLLIEMGVDDFKKSTSGPPRTYFESVLKKRLTDVGFNVHPLSEEEKAERVFQKRFKSISGHILKFIKYARVQCISPDEVALRLNNKHYTTALPKKVILFSELANNVYGRYMKYLDENNLYDFPRLIEVASRAILEQGDQCTMLLGPNKDVKVKLKDIEWVLIDEFQDCSPIFHLLIGALQKANPRVHFACVGDDWQAIYGFAGSDTKYMADFSSYFLESKYSYLLTNFRSSAQVVEVGNNLMTAYGTKAVAGKKEGGAWNYTIPPMADVDSPELSRKKYIDAIRQIIQKYPTDTTFAILHRTQKFFGVPFFGDKQEGKQLITDGIAGSNDRYDLSTIHRYKGREADVVIIVNASQWNHPLMHPDRSEEAILGLTDDKVMLEERRLFYVAVTRAKKDLYILCEAGKESSFITELSGTAR